MGELRKKPETQKEIADQLWYAIIGTNGDGMAERLRRVESWQTEHDSRLLSPPTKTSKEITFRRMLETAIMGIVVVLGIGILGSILLGSIDLADLITAAINASIGGN